MNVQELLHKLRNMHPEGNDDFNEGFYAAIEAVRAEIKSARPVSSTNILPIPAKITAAYAPGNAASKEAAKKIQPKLTGIRLQVFEHIKRQVDFGATGSEIADCLDILPYTAKPRCTELRDMGLIKDSGRTRKNENRSHETVWIAK